MTGFGLMSTFFFEFDDFFLNISNKII